MVASKKFLAGALVGAAAAALLTPLTGKKARKKVAEAANRAGLDREKLEGALGAVVEKSSELLRTVREEAAEKRSGSKTKTKSK
ncbi:MAG: YtxH domain-containing protein [Parcubacteria group bacterium]|nr:YtxH domain-containing protein [Parcubacteria group bacterium]